MSPKILAPLLRTSNLYFKSQLQVFWKKISVHHNLSANILFYFILFSFFEVYWHHFLLLSLEPVSKKNERLFNSVHFKILYLSPGGNLRHVEYLYTDTKSHHVKYTETQKLREYYTKYTKPYKSTTQRASLLLHEQQPWKWKPSRIYWQSVNRITITICILQ